MIGKKIAEVDFDKYVLNIMFFAVLIVALYLSKYNYLFFHSIVEVFIVLISYSIMILSINTLNISQNKYFTFLGINYAFIGTLSLLHLLTYRDINLLNTNSENISIQLWVAAAYWQSISILVAFKYLDRKVKYTKIIVINLTILILLILSIFHFKVFPNCYVNGIGVTRFKIISIYIIVMISAFSIYFIYKHKIVGYKLMICSIAFSIVAQLLFLPYYNGTCNILGHAFKFISSYFLYKAIMIETLKNPLKAIFGDLKAKKNELERINEELNARNKELEYNRVNLRKNNEKYKKLLNFIPDAVILIDKDEITYVNKKALELLNATDKDELLGKNIYSIIHIDFWDKVKKRLEIGYKGKLLPPLEEKVFTTDRKIIDVEVSSISVYIDDKECHLKIIRDITNKKKMEEMKLKLQENIQNDKIRNEFFANISHELRTPINVIYSALQLEDLYIDENNIIKIKEYNNVIKQNCYRLIRLVNNIIDITKIDSGFLKANFCYSNIVYVVENIVMSIVPYVKNKNMDIIFDTDMEEQYIKCDLDFMERIVLNLISNSIKYGKENGIIEVSIYHSEDSYINISVKDNGIGIPEEKQEDIFDRFVQVDKILTRRSEGSGIGLSLVKSLVEMQNGKIKLISKEGIGTEIIVTFPVEVIDEVACSGFEKDITDEKSIIEKINIEFSDIYL